MWQLQRIHNALLLVAVLACCVSIVAQTRPQGASSPRPSSAPATTAEPTVGNITGSVVNESGQPLAGVRVQVRDINGSAGRSSMTDASGNFKVDGLGAALYFVSAYYPAYVTQPTDAVWPFN